MTNGSKKLTFSWLKYFLKNWKMALGRNMAAKTGTNILSNQTIGRVVILWKITMRLYWPR